MYSISIRERFTSFLRLENSADDEGYDLYHNYLMEVVVSGEELDERGYLHNMDDLREELGELVVKWDGALLND
ncbi:MAG TPA: hypothetical protein ENH10_07745, partial [Bacteroidetes bacterium]|nr:hypothetical protein [Bacteroidota bacterium]HEX05030.1 hypothetical protein [Bacteroidota bacterium]